MDYIQIRKKGQITLPKAVRESLGLAEGDVLAVDVRDDELVLRPQQLVDRSQAWFWTPEWQAAEREADRDVAEGRLRRFETMEELIADLHAGAAAPEDKSA